MNAHELDYRLIGEEMQAIEIHLDPGETVVAEAGSMMMMDTGIQMDTIFGDGSGQDKSVFGSFLSAGKRLLTGEGLFMTTYTNMSDKVKTAVFASPYPGKIIALDLKEEHGKVICQKDAFLCAAKGVSVSLEFKRRLGTGFFGGEGFIMQKLEGNGLVFMHAGGTIIERELQAGEVLKIDTGCLVGFTREVAYDIEFIGGLRNTFFGGEGVFLARLSGPGKVFIQSLPFSRLADRVLAGAPKSGGKRRGDGGLLGEIGNILDGDNRF